MRYLSLLLLLLSTGLSAQLDTLHWLPPMHARDGWGPQYLYLSTPEAEPFPVRVRDGAGNLLFTATISNTQPYRHDLGSSSNTAVLVPEASLHQPLTGKGLVLDGPKKFYAYFRVHSNSRFHAGDLTCKGRAALGRVFRIGHLLQEPDERNSRANFVGVMATEDSTVVTLSGFHPGTDFRIAGANVPQSGPVTVLLHAGESAVFSAYLNDNLLAQPPNGLMGSLLEASKPVAVNCGSWCGAPVLFQANDIGIDQIAPLENVGDEYILCRGNGSAVLEHPIVIAHYDGTQVWLNNGTTPAATLDAGDYFAVGTNLYTAAGNLYIRSSRPVFVYQMIGGAPSGNDESRTAGLIFVPPISCAISNSVDNIFQPNLIGDMLFEGGLMIVAMKDSALTVRLDGQPVAIGAPAAVLGNPDFVTYRSLNLFSQFDTPNTISVVAEGAVQVAMFGRNEPASFAAFFSGFSKDTKPDITLTRIGDGVCPDTLVASGLFDGVQWMYGDSLLKYGPDTFLVAYAPGQYSAIGYLGVCRRTDSAIDTLTAVFNSPQFPWSIDEPSCFGFRDGQIIFGVPYGGLEPYQYSVDKGHSFTQDPVAEGIGAGIYSLVVRDATGCYNRPLEISVGQPDSFGVRIVPWHLPEPLHPGGRVVLEGRPDRPVISTEWAPADSTGCADCLRYTFHPEENTWVRLTVYDTAGCPATDRILIEVEPEVYAPNVFDPEASGPGNDRFTLYSRDPLPILRLAIYDRWGDQVYYRENLLTNSPADGWDGRVGDSQAQAGVYVFWAEVALNSGKTAIVKGDVLLLR